MSIDNVPEDTVNKLIAGMSSAGDLSEIDREVERYEAFAKSGLTELSIRLFDDPMDGLELNRRARAAEIALVCGIPAKTAGGESPTRRLM